MPKCILLEQAKAKPTIALQYIAVTTPPTKTVYSPGESFDTTGMVVTGYYGTSSSTIVKTIPITGYLVTPNPLVAGITAVTISSTEAGKTFTIQQPILVTDWSWGSETATADAAWFMGLQAVVQAGGADSSWVGKTKSVTLTSSVLGTTTHLIRCIGVNQDGNNTVTFQTKNCLSTSTTFGSSNAQWIGSTARTQCINYYNAFPGKAYIKTVSKGTCANVDDTTATYNNETVWIPSIYEVGLSSYGSKPKGAEYTNGCFTAYSYYSSNVNRVKNQSDSSSATARWWTRSLRSDYAYCVCPVDANGSAGSDYYNSYLRLAPAFVIG